MERVGMGKQIILRGGGGVVESSARVQVASAASWSGDGIFYKVPRWIVRVRKDDRRL